MYGLGSRIALVAFDGWNDAGEAASQAVRAVRGTSGYAEAYAVDPELYFDYQYTRPTVANDGPDGARRLHWPEATLQRPDAPIEDVEVWLLAGTEPARAWQSFAADFADKLLAADVSAVIAMGSLLSDVPHTRALPVSATSEDPQVRAAYGLERSQYEGPVGILSVIGEAAAQVGIPTVSVWASVPHYVASHAPSPKASLALLERVADLVGVDLPLGSLAAEAARWEATVDAAIADDEDLREYVAQLEAHRDTVDSPEASGDALAREFERYLRRDGGTDGRRGDGPRRS